MKSYEEQKALYDGYSASILPRIREAEELGYEYFTMDDEKTYGEEFFRYGFGQAVDENVLSDYKVIVLQSMKLQYSEGFLISLTMKMHRNLNGPQR